MLPSFPVNRTFEQRRHKCQRCGEHQHRTPSECPAYRKPCERCGIPGHLARKCRTRPENLRNEYRGEKRKHQSGDHGSRHKYHVRQVDARYSVSDEEPEEVRRVRDVSLKEPDSLADQAEELNVAYVNTKEELIIAKVGKIAIEMFIDSGSKYNLVDDQTWRFLLTHKCEAQLQTQRNNKVMGYGQNRLNVMAVFKTEIEVNDAERSAVEMATFYVIQGGQQPLLGSVTARSLGVLRTGFEAQRSDVRSVQSGKEFPCMKG